MFLDPVGLAGEKGGKKELFPEELEEEFCKIVEEYLMEGVSDEDK